MTKIAVFTVLLSIAIFGLALKAAKPVPPQSGLRAEFESLERFLAKHCIELRVSGLFTVNGGKVGGKFANSCCDGHLFVVVLNQSGDGRSLLSRASGAQNASSRFVYSGQTTKNFPWFSYWRSNLLHQISSEFKPANDRRFNAILGLQETGNCNMIETLPWNELWRVDANGRRRL